MTNSINAIVTDVEGTTSSLSFVKDILFPYAAERIADYVRENKDRLTSIMDEVRDIERNYELTSEDIIDLLLRWAAEDQKLKPLKTIQGLIWKGGYESGALKGHIYEDAWKALQSWHDEGIRLYVYSSGSVTAQRLIFGHTSYGDLTPLFSGHFDTEIGGKKEASSYRTIAAEIGQPPAKILFLSDIQAEIDAAAQAGFQTMLVDRDHKNKNAVHSFADIVLKEKAA